MYAVFIAIGCLPSSTGTVFPFVRTFVDYTLPAPGARAKPMKAGPRPLTDRRVKHRAVFAGLIRDFARRRATA